MKCWILDKSTPSYSIDHFLESGKKHGIEIDLIDIDSLDSFPKVNFPDFVMPRLGAKIDYFALSLVRYFESQGIPSFNTSNSIDLTKDKFRTYQLLKANNIPTPKTILAKFPINFEYVKHEIGFPIIVKTLSGTQGEEVYLCESESEFVGFINFIKNMNEELLFQEFIEESRGKDLRIFIIDGKVVAGMQRFSEADNFRANYSLGGAAKAIKITPDIENISLQVSNAFGLDIAGIDLLYLNGGYTVCEANSSPGFKGIESCHNINVADEIFKAIIQRLN